MTSKIWAVVLLIGFFGCEGFAQDAGEGDGPDPEWIELFNGKDLTGWTPKIKGYELGNNYANTFRVEDGVLQVRYDQYEGPFDRRFGHLFYKAPFDNYVIELEYRFVGNQIEGGPGWALRNSGIMIHGQDPTSMAVDQDFPVSIEVQLLGGDGNTDRSTLNLCTPGTNVVMNGGLFKQHCTSSQSKTYHGEQWVKCVVEVEGDKVVRHKVGGEVVLEYQSPQLDPRDADAQKLIQGDNLLLSGGTISLQSESHPVDFRNIRIRKLAVKK